MLSQSRGLRLALVLLMSVGYVSWHGHTHLAFANTNAAGDDDDDDGGGGGDDDDDGGKGGGDDDDDGGDDDKDQPAVTSGGLYTLKTYPIRELFRPLTMTQKIGQVRVGVGTDLSAKGAFETFGVNLEGVYGLTDNFTVLGGFTDAYNFKQFGVYFGFEGALAYDLIDIRLAANVHRFAYPELKTFDDGMGGMTAPLPTGKYTAGGTQFSLDLGFPFRYVAKPEIAIVALETLMSFDFNSGQSSIDDGMGGTIKVGNGAKPDLNPSLGIVTNPIAPLSVKIYAQLRIPDFDTSKGNFQVPATARVEFSPNQKLDLGLEFTFVNVKPPEGQTFYDNRFLSLFMQFRAGK